MDMKIIPRIVINHGLNHFSWEAKILKGAWKKGLENVNQDLII